LNNGAENLSKPDGRKYSINTFIEFKVATNFLVLDENGIGGVSNKVVGTFVIWTKDEKRI
jgi:hypothetical protein